MSDIKNQLIKDSYNYVLQSDINTGVVYRIGGDVPVNPIFQSGLTINSSFTFQNGTEFDGYVLTSDSNGNARWAGVSGVSVASVTASTGLSGNSTTGTITLVNTAPDKTVVITGGTGIQIISSYPNFGINYTGQTSFPYLPLTGGTVTGNVIFQSGITANTISGGTFYGNGSGLTNVVNSITTSTGLSANTTTGTITLVNTSPDKTVTITGGTGIQIISSYPNFGINFTGQTSFPYLPLSGGTVTGNVILQSGLTANTISATTYYGINAVTGGTYSNGRITLGGSGNINTIISGLTALTPITLYSGDGTLTGNRIVSLSSNTLTFSSSTDSNLLVLSGRSIGIGTNPTSERLNVSGNTKFTLGSGGYVKLEDTVGGVPTHFQASYGNTLISNNAIFDVATSSWKLSTNGAASMIQMEPTLGQFVFNTTTTTGLAGETVPFIETLRLVDGKVGINHTTPTNKLHIVDSSDPIRIVGVQTSTDGEYLTIDSNGVVHKSTSTSPTKKLVLKTIELGSKVVQNKSVDNILLPNFLKNVFNYESALTDNTITGLKYDFYFTINDDSKRIKILYSTKYQNEITGTFFSDMNDFIYNLYGTITVNFYLESYIDVDYTYNSPTEMKLVNPLFNSLRPSKYSRGGQNYLGKNQYVRNILSPQNDDNAPFAHSNNIRSEFYLGWSNYYDYNTSNDISRKIYDIVNASPGLYGNGDLRDSSITALFNGYDNDVRESLNNATYVESNKNVYSKFRVPVNQYGFLQSMRNRNHNFYGTLLYDLVGGSDGNRIIYSSNTNVKSQAFLQLVDTYRIYSEGNPGTIFANTDFEQDTHLNDLQYKVGIPKNLKYISPSVKLDGEYGTKRDRSYIQVLPGYSETYLLKINVTGNPGDYGVNVNFINSLLQDYLVTNDPSNPKDHNYWYNFTTGEKDYYPVTTILDNSTNFVEPYVNPYGSYIIIQSNDEKMYTLSQNPTYTSAGGEISVEAIYKGHSFTPLLYPLNFSQLLLEVPESYYYDLGKDDIVQSKNSVNNTTELSGNQVTDKKLRLIVKYKNLNKYDLIEVPLKCTSTRSSRDNKIFELTIENGDGKESIENLIIKSLKKNKLKNFKPGNVEIYFAFLKINDNTNLNKTSIIPNYKMIITKYGDNEVFKLIRENSDNNIVFP